MDLGFLSNEFGSDALVINNYTNIMNRVAQYLQQLNDDVTFALNTVRSGVTFNREEEIWSPETGRMNRGARLERPELVVPSVPELLGYPIVELSLGIGYERITGRNLSVAILQRALTKIFTSYLEEIRIEAFRPIWVNTSYTHTDTLLRPVKNLTVYPLANNDAMTYHIAGTMTKSTLNAYAGIDVAIASLTDSDATNPAILARDYFRNIYGEQVGNIVLWVNPTIADKMESVYGSFIAAPEASVIYGSGATLAVGHPDVTFGKYRGKLNEVYVYSWEGAPAGYGYAQCMEQPKPLMERRLPAATNPQGLSMIMQRTPNENWVYETYFEAQMGFGANNRTNGWVFLMGSGATSYTAPAWS